MNFSRREMLCRTGLGLGGLALSSLLQAEEKGSGAAHFPAKAKSVILLFQSGGPSQMDLFDPKPELQKRGGEKIPLAIDKFLPGNSDTLLASPFKFHKRGKSGTEMSELLPHLGNIADDLCVVRSMHTGHDNHTEGTIMLNTGKFTIGRPSLGSWVGYGLGSANKNLPGYVVLRDPAAYDSAGSLAWSPGWLSAMHGGTEFNSKGIPVPNLRTPGNVTADARREDLDLLAALNDKHKQQFPKEAELEARIRNYELAARMQTAATEALDLAKETAETRKQYGLDDPASAGYGTRCLLARRLVESGVRFIHVYSDQTGQGWDSHSKLKPDLEKMCKQTDQSSAALIRDLKARGLLDSTIVIWAGEFGRLPVSQNADGRDHNRHAFSLFLAGGGFKGGIAHGKTDEFGYKSIENRVSVADLHATILHQMGLDHTKLTVNHHGRDESLTDSTASGAKVVTELLMTSVKK
ncbi:MAG: DUF1501 domain-containing protein [Planctomycetes bacterium]|nr:DUF1501 domain-containing protein [Planctomycetota bacterium]